MDQRTLRSHSTTRTLAAYCLTMCLFLGTTLRSLGDDQLICCGAEEVFILRLDENGKDAPESIWSWRASDSPGVPEALRKTFASTDECKPVGEHILITSSSGGVALVLRSDKTCHFFAIAKNAHSACLLPDYRVAVASSFGGDELLVYELEKPDGAPTKPLAKIALRGAHGAVWDKQLKRLWALGSDELLLVDIGKDRKTTKLNVEKRIQLPTPGGHDLSPTREQAIMHVTTNKHVYRFNKDDASFSPAPILADLPKVKSVSENPDSGRIVYHQGTPENWWSDMIRFTDQEKAIHLPGRRLYKIRWDRTLSK
ncbi:MAG: DUF6528 family protein [Planctomycetota bacterium]